MACSRPEAAIHVTRYKMNKIPNEDVTVVLEPMAETDILAETAPDANAADIEAALAAKAQDCVNHLCGCS